MNVRFGYVSALDGIRGVAVLLVMFAHANWVVPAGGTVGVTVFFVLSGFLITSLLLGELDATGRVNLPKFWVGVLVVPGSKTPCRRKDESAHDQKFLTCLRLELARTCWGSHDPCQGQHGIVRLARCHDRPLVRTGCVRDQFMRSVPR